MGIDRRIAEDLGPDDPREIGPFTILGLLGTGGMGEVYLGAGEQGYAAVKRVRPRLVSGERFKREVGLLYRVPSEVAPGVLASDGTAARPWFATEYVPGLTVDEAVRLRGPLPAEDLWLLLAETAAQLRTVHRLGIVHRDLKPANVMLVVDGIRLIDFGIARAADQARLTRSGGSYGTRGFTPPEQESGDDDVAEPADVYALGALVLYAASGRTPGLVPDVEALRAVDAELAEVVEPCLAAQPEARPTAQSLAEAARAHVAAADVAWPAEVMERISARQQFAETPVSRMETLPPPEDETAAVEVEKVPSAERTTRPVAEASSATTSHLRWKLAALPAVAILLLGGAAAVTLLPRSSPPRTAHADAVGSTVVLPAAKLTQTSTLAPSRSTSPPPGTAETATPTSATSATSALVLPPSSFSGIAASTGSGTSAAPPAAQPDPTASAISGISGGSDPARVPGSEADTDWVGNDAACSAWLDDDGSGALAGVLNTSLTQSCVAELFRSDGMAYTFSTSWGAEKTNFITDAGFTMWICVWHADDQSSDETCSARFGMSGHTPVRE